VAQYSWPAQGDRLGEAARDRWTETIEALPVGSAVTGEVIGRQPFGVFVAISAVPGAIGLAEITSMPGDTVLPLIGTVVCATVIDHVAHNHEVKLRLVSHRAEADPVQTIPTD
jgi:ribosomal protein S1